MQWQWKKYVGLGLKCANLRKNMIKCYLKQNNLHGSVSKNYYKK